jgi:hypothetical protein
MIPCGIQYVHPHGRYRWQIYTSRGWCLCPRIETRCYLRFGGCTVREAQRLMRIARATPGRIVVPGYPPVLDYKPGCGWAVDGKLTSRDVSLARLVESGMSPDEAEHTLHAYKICGEIERVLFLRRLQDV